MATGDWRAGPTLTALLTPAVATIGAQGTLAYGLRENLIVRKSKVDGSLYEVRYMKHRV